MTTICTLTNLFEQLKVSSQQGSAAAGEQFETLLSLPDLKIERIVSTGQSTPPGEWYDQPQHEWVVVLSGEARFRFKDEPHPRLLKKGDFVDIPPHRQHRVESTHLLEPTIWLAIHYKPYKEAL